MHGERGGRCETRVIAMAALLALLVGVAPAAGKAKRSVPFKLPLPAEGSTATRVMKVNLVAPRGGRAAARKPKLVVSVANPGGLPDGVGILGRLWRDPAKPRKATIAIAAIRPKAGGSARAHAAQDLAFVDGRVRFGGFNAGVTGSRVFVIDWTQGSPTFPSPCPFPSAAPISASDVLTERWGDYDSRTVGEWYFAAGCEGGDPFLTFVQTGQMPGDGPPPPTINMQPFPGNPREASIFITRATPFDAIRIQAGANTSFSQCFSGGRPCTVGSPGTMGNFILFEFPDGPVTDSGELNARAGNVDFNDWNPPGFLISSPDSATFDGPYSAP